MSMRGAAKDVMLPKARGGPWAQAARRLMHKKLAFGALIVIVVIYLVGALATWSAPQSYRETPSTDLDLPGFPGIVLSPSWPQDKTVFNHTSVGIFRSEDGGESWETAGEGIGATNVSVLVSTLPSTRPAVLYAATPKRVFRSTDSGGSWAGMSMGLSRPNINDLAVSPGFERDATLFAALSSGVFRTTDGGDSWVAVNEGFQSDSPNALRLAISPGYETDRTVFVAVTERKRGSFGMVEEVFRSTDGGQTWQRVYEAPGGTPRDMPLAMSPRFEVDGTVYVSTYAGLRRSTDGGSSWTLINDSFGTSQLLELVVSPAFGVDGTLYANTRNRGIFRSTDRGATWEAVVTGLSIAKSLSLAISPNFGEDQTLYTGTADGGLFRSTNGGDSWDQIASKDLVTGPTLLQWPPSLEHPLGTDRLGRDMFSRIIYGIRTTVIITLASVLTGSLLLGLLLGAAAGFYGGRVDTVIMRVGEIFLAFPGILLIILLAATIKPRVVDWVRDFEAWSGWEGIVRSGAVDYFVVFGALTLFSWVGMARLVRGQILQLKGSQYVEAARAMGASNARIIMRHLLPNAISPVIVSVSMGMGAVAGTEVVLSWFGIGIQPPNPSLGRMILENFGVNNLGILREDPHLILAPTFTIAIIIYAWNLLGDGLNDVLNPRAR